jgi:hypothetical protein
MPYFSSMEPKDCLPSPQRRAFVSVTTAYTLADPDTLAAQPITGKRWVLGPTGGNVRPAAISSNTFFDNILAAHCAVDDHSAEFPKTTSTGNFPPDLHQKSASSGHLRRQSASAEM